MEAEAGDPSQELSKNTRAFQKMLGGDVDSSLQLLEGPMHLVFNYPQTMDSLHFFFFLNIIPCGNWLQEFPPKYCDFPLKINGFS